MIFCQQKFPSLQNTEGDVPSQTHDSHHKKQGRVFFPLTSHQWVVGDQQPGETNRKKLLSLYLTMGLWAYRTGGSQRQTLTGMASTLPLVSALKQIKETDINIYFML